MFPVCGPRLDCGNSPVLAPRAWEVLDPCTNGLDLAVRRLGLGGAWWRWLQLTTLICPPGMLFVQPAGGSATEDHRAQVCALTAQ